MYIAQDDLKTVAYEYQIQDITDNDVGITLQAIAAAEQEVKSYLMPNKYTNYDVAAIFAATGTARNPLLMEHIKTCAVWYLVRLSNVDMLHEHVKERYDRTMEWLRGVNKGNILIDLPTLPIDGEGNGGKPFRSGSRSKFTHDFE